MTSRYIQQQLKDAQVAVTSTVARLVKVQHTRGQLLKYLTVTWLSCHRRRRHRRLQQQHPHPHPRRYTRRAVVLG